MGLSWAIIGTVVGVALGLRFKVLVLVPAIAVTVIFVLMVGIIRGDSFWSIVLGIVIASTAIQLGYLVGIYFAKRIQ
jgi:hypothetical protein